MADRSFGAKRATVRACVAYVSVWLACLALYWASLAAGVLGGGMIMGYTLLVLYFALPIVGAVSAFLVGRAGGLGRWRLAVPFSIAVLYALFIVATFGLSTTLGLANIAPADPAVLVCAGFVPAALGLAAGWAAA